MFHGYIKIELYSLNLDCVQLSIGSQPFKSAGPVSIELHLRQDRNKSTLF